MGELQQEFQRLESQHRRRTAGNYADSVRPDSHFDVGRAENGDLQAIVRGEIDYSCFPQGDWKWSFIVKPVEPGNWVYSLAEQRWVPASNSLLGLRVLCATRSFDWSRRVFGDPERLVLYCQQDVCRVGSCEVQGRLGADPELIERLGFGRDFLISDGALRTYRPFAAPEAFWKWLAAELPRRKMDRLAMRA